VALTADADATPTVPTAPAKPVAKAAPKPAATTPAPAPTTPVPTTGQLDAGLWPKVLVVLKPQNNNLCALLQMYPVDFGDGEIIVRPKFNFHRDLLLKPANRTMIEATAAKVYGRPVKLSARTDEAAPKARKPKTDPTAELVSSALEILGGEVVD
jgi:hypothetical protein